MAKTKTIQKTLKKAKSELWEQYHKNKLGWMELARMYVEAVDAFEGGRESIQETFKKGGENLSVQFWNRLEDVGRGAMHWKLLPGISEGNSVYIRRLPFSRQTELLNGKKIPLLLRNNDSIMVDARYASREQADQLFAEDHLRGLDEQKVHMCKNIPSKEEVEAVKEPYIITNRGLVIKPHNKKILIPKSALKRILKQL